MKAFRHLLVFIVFATAALAQDTGKPKIGDTPVKRTGKIFVQVFFEENCKGRPVRLEVPCEHENFGRPNDTGIKNDSIMSMKIPEGVSVTLFDAANFGGPSQTFTGKVDTLGKLKGTTSSLKATINNAPGPKKLLGAHH